MENFENEIWRPVVDYENFYMVSNYARLKSLDRFKKGKKGANTPQKGKFLSVDYSSKNQGYVKPRIQFCRNGEKKKYNVSVIVAKAFPDICGEWFDGCEVHHIDENPENNVASNLKVLSKEAHSELHRLSGKYNGARNPFYGKHHKQSSIEAANKIRRKPIYQYTPDGECICYWYSCTDCERETGMKKTAINRCCRGFQEMSYGYIWKYAKEGD